jgi:N-acetylmuramoyl-L-alanine amidase
MRPRTINFIVLHCTATPQTATVQSIRNYWKSIGWKNVGYHWLIDASGKAWELAKDHNPTNGVAGNNKHSIHISYIGGVDPKNTKIPLDNRTPAQLATMERLVRQYKAKYHNAKVLGHKDFPKVAKACPSFEVAEWCASLTPPIV